MTDPKVQAMLDYFKELFPFADCELNFSNPLELLISVMLSAQTTDKQVNVVTADLFDTYQTLGDYLDAEISDIEQIIKRIGLYRNKARNVKLMTEQLFERFDGVVPNTREELMSLPGVGRKTANVVMAVGFGLPAIPVDTHVERVSKRLKLAFQNDSVLKVEQKLMKKLPKETWAPSHHQFIFFGRYFCTAQSPKCHECKLTEYCRVPKSR